MTTVKRYLINNKPYKDYMITKATSSEAWFFFYF
jgi:hypothetical protein